MWRIESHCKCHIVRIFWWRHTRQSSFPSNPSLERRLYGVHNFIFLIDEIRLLPSEFQSMCVFVWSFCFNLCACVGDWRGFSHVCGIPSGLHRLPLHLARGMYLTAGVFVGKIVASYCNLVSISPDWTCTLPRIYVSLKPWIFFIFDAMQFVAQLCTMGCTTMGSQFQNVAYVPNAVQGQLVVYNLFRSLITPPLPPPPSPHTHVQIINYSPPPPPPPHTHTHTLHHWRPEIMAFSFFYPHTNINASSCLLHKETPVIMSKIETTILYPL